MAKFIAEYKVSGDLLSMTVRNKQLDSSEVQAFFDKALKEGLENVDFVSIRRVKVKPVPAKPEVKK